MSDLQPTDLCEHIYFLTVIKVLGELVLKEIDVRFEVVSCLILMERR